MYSSLLYLIIFIIFNTCISVILPKNTYKTNTDIKSNPNSRNDYLRNYAGMGFDLIVGNPFDNFSDLNTFGFRSSIISQPIIKVDEHSNISVKGNNNIWIRSVVNCHQDYEPYYIETGSDLIQELFNDFTLDNRLSEDLWKRNVDNKLDLSKFVNEGSKFKIIKCHCSLYENGLVLPYNGLLSKEFEKTIDKLPNQVETDSECPIDLFLTEPDTDKCKYLRTWINLFQTYGTHITTYALLGSYKISYKYSGGKFINMESSVNIHLIDRRNNSNVNKNIQTSDIFKRKVKGSKLKRHLWVIGGSFVKGLDEINPKTFSRWVKTIKYRPMPIRAKFSMLSIFFPEKNKAYLSSLEYYSQLIAKNKKNLDRQSKIP